MGFGLSLQIRLSEACVPSPTARYSGFQFAAYRSGQYFQGHGGFTYVAGGEPVKSDTLFDLASLTKLFTASVAARLSAAGELDLDAPVSSWSKLKFHPTQRALSSRDLLTHISGLPAEWTEKGSRAQTINSLLDTPSDPKHKGDLLYACTGYSLFALALEEATGNSIGEWIKKLVTNPLELANVTYRPDKQESVAVSCTPEQVIPAGIVHDPRARALGGVSGNAGLFGNSIDLLKFAIEVGFGTYGVLEDEARKLLSTPSSSGEWGQALGFRVGDTNRIGPDRNWLSHSGFTGTLLIADPDGERAGVLLTNRLSFDSSREGIAEIYRSFSDSLSSGEIE